MRCEECGFSYDSVERDAIAAALREVAGRWREHLAPLVDADRRPGPEVWSPIEYGCHVRDVLLSQRERLLLALVEDSPSFRPMYRDERVVLARYAGEAPAVVADEIVVAADLLGRVFDGLDAAQLARTCTYNYPEPAVRELAWLGQHTVHEAEHHLLDASSRS